MTNGLTLEKSKKLQNVGVYEIKKNERINEIKLDKYGTPMKIVEYINSKNIIVEFQDEYKNKIKCTYSHFKNKSIRNPNKSEKTVYGIGTIGNTSTNDKQGVKKSYDCWHSMMNRCYSGKYTIKYGTYVGCTVCEEWLCYANFEKWYNDNYYRINNKGAELDKDILVKGNKIYSPNTCVFVSNEINCLFTKSNKTRGIHPIGVSCIGDNRYFVRFQKENKLCHFGTFDNEIQAFEKYKEEKEKYIKFVADKYKENIPTNLYDALYSYKVEITD